MLAPLAANDGPVLRGVNPLLTHSPLIGSPVLDAGDPAAIAGTGLIPILDERGTGFTRVYNATGLTLAQIDIGAIEFQPSPLVGDYNFNGIVDGADYTVWRNTVGSTNDKRADGNRDGVVDAGDYLAWKQHYGETLVTASAASGAGLIAEPADTNAVTESVLAESVSNDSGANEGSLASGSLALGMVSTAETTRPAAAALLNTSANAAPSVNDAALLEWLALAATSSTTGSPADDPSGAVTHEHSAPAKPNRSIQRLPD